MKARPPPTFIRENLAAGMIMHGRDTRPGRTFGRLIRTTLTRGMRFIQPMAGPVWGNHDALFVPGPRGTVGVGDSAPWRARITPLDEYEREMALGRYAVRVFTATGTDCAQGRQAAEYWRLYINRTFYDLRAFPYLLAKNMFQGSSITIRDWEWAYWCTEGCRTAWAKGAGYDPWSDEHPTPLTTEKRAWPEVYGVEKDDSRRYDFVDVTDLVMRNSVNWVLHNGEWIVG